MKKLIATLIVTLASVNAFAQGSSTASLGTNVRAKRSSGLAIMPAISVGATQLTDLKDFGHQAKAGTGVSINAGVLAELGRGTFVLQSGLLYLNQNTSADVNQTDFINGGSNPAMALQTKGTFKLQMTQLAIPLAVKARTRVAEGIRLTGRLGLMTSFLMSAKTEESGSKTFNGVTTVQQSVTNSDKSMMRSVNFSGIAGFGPEFAIARNQNLRIELGYERTLTALGNGDLGSTKSGIQSLNLLLAYAAGF